MIPHYRLRLYALSGKHTVLVWCRDMRDTWESELERGKRPERLRGLKVDLSSVFNGARLRSVRVYDLWRNHWSNGKPHRGQVALPEFARSIVIRVTR
jgi:hypothetical protein